jgi:hypothetical protein
MTMNRNFSGLLVALLAAALFSGCGAPVRAEFDQRVDFDRYRTFAWVAPERDRVADPLLDSEILDRRMRAAVQSELIARGYELVQAEEADFLVTYHSATRERMQQSGMRVSIGYHRGYPFWYGGTVADSGARSFREGTIMIDIIDRADETLVWRGWRSAEVDQRRYTEERVRRLAADILGDFPPQRRR